MSALTSKRCKPCEGGVDPLTSAQSRDLLGQLVGWTLREDAHEIQRLFEFKNFVQAMTFANAVAWIAEQEGHHPDLEVGWGRCLVRYSTHAIDGLSENDFICAAKVDALLPAPSEESPECTV
jgi:4a-hydroxytetrahydrobiopterin dehydratase